MATEAIDWLKILPWVGTALSMVAAWISLAQLRLVRGSSRLKEMETYYAAIIANLESRVLLTEEKADLAEKKANIAEQRANDAEKRADAFAAHFDLCERNVKRLETMLEQYIAGGR